jgi:uncharacterized protein (TIGR02444 family)
MVEVECNLWSFSLRIYDSPGVAQACIWLQDRRGLDVNMLLFCVWAGLGRAELERDLVTEANEIARDWSTRVVLGLRAARRGLASSGYDELRSEVQRLELAAEKIEQELLESLVTDPPTPGLRPAIATAAARRNLKLYLETAGVPLDPEVENRIEVLIGAV